ncbi:tRNA (adenosine(37)-N6)-threonylcarbamoyltransferase complex ATPase subunit type 1 TsaE [uncultured Aliiroseovarius sp.]|uniref:tRNA (adenosine(37)-N6)-threonylcarbamoyltransferase complex ATPase subunit type 1 TsaE n=1 Tax=uncultured Aliiroseovarius sp. TaxID=1658783 RepID=UPI0026361494|nr:tRNA (adenosine(37)-N6)-threonylcarbamoyltransferase complex ATPase subunit type 1 TsaE [uncultured Aliiroseovarius sp.]
MSQAFHQQVQFRSPEETAGFAARFSQCLKQGDVILLEGSIGAGKTHFARALIQTRLAAASAMEDVPSPTFTLVQTYDDGCCEIWHADLYRLTHPDEVEELGLLAAFETAICLVEWPDRLGNLAPPSALKLTFEMVPDPVEHEHRLVTISSANLQWQSRVEAALRS